MAYDGTSYDGENWMIAWEAPNLKVGPWPDKTGWSKGSLISTSGYCFFELHGQDDQEIAERLVGQALYLISEGVPVGTVFEEFAKIRIWREMKIKLTTPGGFWAFHPKVGYHKMNPYNNPDREDA